MKFAMLGSGSRGNAALVQAGDTCVMIDCGLPLPEVELRLQRLEFSAEHISAILVTHEHGDHLAGVAKLARKYQIPVWLTTGSLRAWRDAPGALCRMFDPHTRFTVGDLCVQPFPVPHDAREPCQYVCGDGAARIGILSDAGTVTRHILESLSGCDALLLEFNHDSGMLADGPYSRKLKRRVGGPYGHLSNAQAAALLGALDCSRLQHFVATHLSEINNTPAHVRTAAAAALNCSEDWIQCAHQDLGLGWRTVS